MYYYARTSNSAASVAANTDSQPLFTEALSKTVKAAFRDEKARSDVVVGRLKEKGNDQHDVAELCSKINFSTRPTDTVRLGKKRESTDDYPRPLKVSFSSPFDAKAFCARFKEEKGDHEEFSNLRVHPWRTKEEHMTFKKNSDIAFKLNKEAKENGDTISFSVRDTGAIWKYQKDENGKWTKVQDWSIPETPSENGQAASKA